MAVQSDDTPAGRPCEQCAAEVLNGGVKHSPPYIWNNSNYLLKMTEDLKFLVEVDPLVTWLGAGDSDGSGGDGDGGAFDLKDNPFLLADPENDEDEDVTEEVSQGLLIARTEEEMSTWCRHGGGCGGGGANRLRLAESPFSLPAQIRRERMLVMVLSGQNEEKETTGKRTSDRELPTFGRVQYLLSIENGQ